MQTLESWCRARPGTCSSLPSTRRTAPAAARLPRSFSGSGWIDHLGRDGPGQAGIGATTVEDRPDPQYMMRSASPRWRRQGNCLGLDPLRRVLVGICSIRCELLVQDVVGRCRAGHSMRLILLAVTAVCCSSTRSVSNWSLLACVRLEISILIWVPSDSRLGFFYRIEQLGWPSAMVRLWSPLVALLHVVFAIRNVAFLRRRGGGPARGGACGEPVSTRPRLKSSIQTRRTHAQLIGVAS